MSESAGGQRMNLWRELTIQAVIVMEISWGVLWLQAFSPLLIDLAVPKILMVFWATLLTANLMARSLYSLALKDNIHKNMVIGYVFF